MPRQHGQVCVRATPNLSRACHMLLLPPYQCSWYPQHWKKELSKTLFLQSLQMPGGTNRKIVTFKKNSPRNVKTNAVCLNRNVLCKLKWKTVKRMTGSGENNDQINRPISNRWFLDGPKKKTKTKIKTNDQLLNYWVEGKVEFVSWGIFVGWGLGYSYHCNPLKT